MWKIKKLCEKKLNIFLKKNEIFLWRIFSPENSHRHMPMHRHRHRHRHRHMHSHRYCICIGKFCKEYLPLQNPKKKSYLRLKIITHLLTILQTRVVIETACRCLKTWKLKKHQQVFLYSTLFLWLNTVMLRKKPSP